ncbi:hypothetical protein [Microbacterium sp. NPDC076911]|uniref:hypothetical protein n=1 Tax=Microbacterium sp. NPDC076911 TaxID=3154958 RepID=UPI00343F0E16
MRGKSGLVIGLAVGYVLGTRAGHERYEQIKTQWLKLWQLDVVQDQVTKATDFAKSSAMALPSTLWDSAVKVAKAASSNGTPGSKLDAVIKANQDSAADVAKAAETTATAVKEAAEDAADEVSGAADEVNQAAKKSTRKRTGA